ncbi:helicase-associated domain-containing protein [Asanoa sp. NPDC050611]|uniref:helicase-associated domain-containing protein n=1 Tax=Asanoa sp. NPDC050611 TaxID=3157098 RepID=UPI0033F2A868
MASALLSWLALRSPDELAAVLRRRGDVLPVADLEALAGRLEKDGSVAAALSTVPLPQAQVVEALAGIGGPHVRPDRLAALLDRSGHDPDLIAALGGLAELALVWPDETGALRMAEPLWSEFEFPLGLGPPAAALLDVVDADRLAGIATSWRVRPDRGAVAAVLADAGRVRAAIDTAPADTRERLDRLAHHGPAVELPGRALAWALDRGLVLPDGWRRATMPREVAMVLRGAHWHAPFDPRPPALAVNLAPTAAVDREAVAAGTLAVQRVGALLDLAERAPLAFLRSGGVGARELRRAAKLTGADETEVRLWLEIGYAAGLLGLVDETVAATAASDEWRAGSPAERLATLVTTWLTLPTVPTAAGRPAGGPQLAALLPDLAWAPVLDARPGLLRLLGELPTGRGAAAAATADDGRLADADAVTAALRWRLPVLLPPAQQSPDPLVEGTLREARLLGVMAHGALSAIGRALVDAPGTVATVAAGLLPEAVAEAIFEADLTVLVPGLPAAPLATLLDAAAERTAADGNAASWRFTPDSVRAALDAGFTADTLLEALRIVTAEGKLPQVLEYLVDDAGRQHGQVRVRAVGCVLRTESPALAAELLGARPLRGLGLAALSPTILTSPRPADETLDALRAAGYSPAGEDATGAPTVRRATRVRATPRRRNGHVPAARSRPAGDLVELAERLLDQGVVVARPHLVAAGGTDGTPPDEPSTRPMLWLVPTETPDPDPAAAVATEVRRHTPQLEARERELLVYAIVVGGPVTIDYRTAGGDFSSRVVEPLELDGKRMVAWCRLREDERVFGLNRIERVRPA